MKALASSFKFNFDYCDNRYSVIRYKVLENGNEITLDLKPDLLIFVDGRCIAIEVDLKTERGEALDAKFKRYKQYLEYSNKQNSRALFSEVWFITRDEALKRRWFSVCESFIDQLDLFNNHLNLIYLSLYQINEYFAKKRKLPSVELVKEKVHPYMLKEKNSTKTLSGLEYYELERLEKANVFYTNFIHQTILICIPARAFESLFIWTVIAVNKYFRNKNIHCELYFVLCYIGEKPKIPVFYNCNNKIEFQEAYKNVILLNVQDSPKFFNSDGKALLESNPIRACVERSLEQH